MKKWYELRLSVLDEYGNTVCVPLNVCGGSRKKEIEKARAKLKQEIKRGIHDEYRDPEQGESLSADIEIHDYHTNGLLYIE